MYSFVARNIVRHGLPWPILCYNQENIVKKCIFTKLNTDFVFKQKSDYLSCTKCLLSDARRVNVGYQISRSLSTSKLLYKSDNRYESDDEYEEELEDPNYKELVRHTFKVSDMGHDVFVIQPYIKWGPSKRTNTTPKLQLDEAVALIKTLPDWNVVSTRLVSMMNFNKPKIFGKGNLEILTELVTKNKAITAVFISLNMLSPQQHRALEEAFNVPVYDRYMIVVQIFKLHATTKAAKIQVAIGEIPYLWSWLKHDHEGMSDKMGGGATIGGPGESYIEIKKRLLQDKERKLKNELQRLKTQRELLRSKRKKLNIPTVAVVGYTNSGKTSLIKALTREETLEPKDVLFATLDVTVHGGKLPSGLKVLFVDTVGFLSDIPTTLIQSFVATLEDAVQADVLIHVQDVSHPDLRAQNDHVMETLKSIKLPEKLIEDMITVGNKIDLISGPLPDLGTSIPVSATLGFGVEELKRKVEQKIIKATGQIFIKIRVPNGGSEYSWLFKEATVIQVTADEKDNQFAVLNTLISEANLNRFKHIFISSKVKRNKG
uniref:Hflx-type G domain-containing protein n=1 Tax=Cuerna arida TaxID=1464854 RepID=A0A1B6H4T3_9HEMI